MEVLCPHCQFSQQVDPSILPSLPCKVTCPQCGDSFSLEEPVGDVVQPASQIVTPPPIGVTPPPIAAESSYIYQPAGFWIRVLAAIIDSVVCNLVVFIMGFAMGMVLNITNNYMGQPAQLLLMLMGIVVTIFYYVFFTGYCGQTPGKMTLSIKVVHKDGGAVGYGQAFVRETICKTISSLVFCIGYLMVAFRNDKRALHDLLAATRVIKL